MQGHRFTIFLIVAVTIVTWAHCSFAQSVPAGPILWLEADKGVVLQDGHVAVWHDQSGNGNDVRMDSVPFRPDYIDSIQPAILFHGWNYLQGPPIFPDSADYTIAVVAKLNSYSGINNLVSGDVHALYFVNDSFPRVVHFWFQDQEVSPIPVWHNGFSAMTALYDEAYQQATLYVNGQCADSSWILSTPDTTLLIGSYNNGYFLQGEISEILLYNRKLDSSETASLQQYLLQRYGIATAAPLAKPDSTFAALPQPFELYPRDGDDSATVPIAGTVYKTGFDSVAVLQFKNDTLLTRISEPLLYNDSGYASFDFSMRIHAELSEYRFEAHLIASGFDSVMAERDSIACGDMFLMDGQSNAAYGFETYLFSNEFCRSFGVRSSQNLRDTLWSESDNDAGAVNLRIQQDIMANAHIPCTSINEAEGGTNIDEHLPNDSDRYDLRTPYGRMLYRATVSGMRDRIKTIYWIQGELNYATGYYDSFQKLFNDWKEDYPNLQRVYLLQNRPNYCGWGNIDMRDVQRWMQDSISAVEPVASAAIPFQNGCHYYDSGYLAMADRFYSETARDFYSATDTMNLRSPNALGAWYTNPSHTQIAILFSPSDAIIHATPDSIVDGIDETIANYLYPDDTSTHVTSISFDGNTMLVNFDKSSAAQSIDYLPDQFYNGTDSIYEAPWLVNSRGIGVLLWHDLPISNEPLSVSPFSQPVVTPQIIPNPASSEISIDASSLSGSIEATLIGELGEVIWQKSLPSDRSGILSFDLSNESSGCFLLRLTDGRSTLQNKFVLER